jgi:hypothetical protein
MKIGRSRRTCLSLERTRRGRTHPLIPHANLRRSLNRRKSTQRHSSSGRPCHRLRVLLLSWLRSCSESFWIGISPSRSRLRRTNESAVRSTTGTVAPTRLSHPRSPFRSCVPLQSLDADGEGFPSLRFTSCRACMKATSRPNLDRDAEKTNLQMT